MSFYYFSGADAAAKGGRGGAYRTEGGDGDEARGAEGRTGAGAELLLYEAPTSTFLKADVRQQPFQPSSLLWTNSATGRRCPLCQPLAWVPTFPPFSATGRRPP